MFVITKPSDILFKGESLLSKISKRYKNSTKILPGTMSDTNTKLKGMLIDYGTTYLNDFRESKIKDPIFTKYKPKPTCVRIRPPPLKDSHTLTDWKAGIRPPFNILHKPKDIIGTIPMKIQKPCEKPIDTDLEEARKTRPRLVMTPAVSMDDVDDTNARKILCDAIYTSDMTKALREAVSPYFSVKAPLPDLLTAGNPMAMRKLQPPKVSAEWRMDSVSWDQRQLRAHCNQTADFWLAQELPRCRACEQSAIVTTHRKMQH